MIVLWIWGCLIPDSELVEIKKNAAIAPIEEIEQQYIQYLERMPSAEGYQALEIVLAKQQKIDHAYVANQRRAVLSSNDHRWGLLGGLIAFFGIFLVLYHRGFILTIPVGMAVSSLAFCDDLRYKGTVIFTAVGVYSMPSARSTKLFSFPKGTNVRIIEQQKGFLLVEWNAQQGWIKENKVLSWDPTQSFVLIEE